MKKCGIFLIVNENIKTENKNKKQITSPNDKFKFHTKKVKIFRI